MTDVTLDQQCLLAESVREAGGEAELLLAAGMVHIWTFFPFLSQARASLRDIGGFVAARLV